MSLEDQVKDIVARVPSDVRDDLKSDLKVLGKALLDVAKNDTLIPPTPSGDVVLDATALGSAVVVSLRSKRERREAAKQAAKDVAKVLFKALVAVV